MLNQFKKEHRLGLDKNDPRSNPKNIIREESANTPYKREAINAAVKCPQIQI